MSCYSVKQYAASKQFSDQFPHFQEEDTFCSQRQYMTTIFFCFDVFHLVLSANTALEVFGTCAHVPQVKCCDWTHSFLVLYEIV